MFVRCVAVRRVTFSVATAALLAGCAATPLGPTVQVMPGPGKTLDAFQADNGACKMFASDQVKGQADAANQRAFGTALLTTALGAGLGAAGGSLGGDAGGGAAVGAAVGAGAGTAIGAGNNSADQQGIQAQYDNAFSQCMYTKGEAVPGYAPVATAYMPQSGPAPDPLIRATQSELIRLGYMRGVADGFTGPKTHGAIASYEQANGLPVDGSASARLLAKLQGTPTHAAAAAPAAAPSAWVAPTTGTPNATPATASAPAASSWVAPTK
jgi:Putative peptidoglycan binding domain